MYLIIDLMECNRNVCMARRIIILIKEGSGKRLGRRERNCTTYNKMEGRNY